MQIHEFTITSKLSIMISTCLQQKVFQTRLHFVFVFVFVFVFQARLAQKRADEVQVRSSGRNRRQEGPKVQNKSDLNVFEHFWKVLESLGNISDQDVFKHFGKVLRMKPFSPQSLSDTNHWPSLA